MLTPGCFRRAGQKRGSPGTETVSGLLVGGFYCSFPPAGPSMLSSVTAKRTLWLRHRLADPASKRAWYRIPFERSSLFGNRLDSAIARATGGKSGFLLQDRFLLGQKRPQPRRRSTERSREAHSCRPGRDFKINWRRVQAPFRKSAKSQATSGGEPAKF